eukprot:TRINITY_DN21075_c0_g1_i1.p1 TRINITY_DN21075_c0_g1~~TRINITY_DN21075_c0_g1_i1.p1  ORF type:complete len:363 (+),score=43.45 TRINITY_DN21075_c0_g1_i1:69-1157(+)
MRAVVREAWKLGHRAFRTTGGVHDSALSAFGYSPIVKLRQLAPRGVNVYLKCESLNPLLSMRDRLSVGLLEWAQLHGKIQPGQPVIDTFSGTSGIGLAMACAHLGHPVIFVLPKTSSVECRRLLRFLGAKVLEAHDPETVATKLADKKGFFFTNYFKSDANIWIHFNRTAPEIMAALGDRKLDFFIAPHGTGGMLKGVGEYLRTHSVDTQICLVEQDGRPHLDYEAMNGPHPSWPTDLLKGWTTDFEPTPISAEVKKRYVDRTLAISGNECFMVAQALAQEEFIFTGISGGALAAGALRVAREAPVGSSVLAVLLDTSKFSMYTPLMKDVAADMSDAERQLLDEVEPAAHLSGEHLARLDCH